MWTDYAFRHPVELVLLSALFCGPVVFFAFQAAGLAASHGVRRPRGLALVALTAGLWSVVAAIQEAFTLYAAQEPGTWLDAVFGNWPQVAVLTLAATAITLIGGPGRRIAATAAFLTFEAFVVSGLLSQAAFGYLGAGERTMLVLLIVFGIALAAAGACFVHTRSHTVRAGAAIAVCWGTTLVSFGLLAGSSSNLSLVQTSRGLMTTEIVWIMTCIVVGACVVIAVENRRLRRNDDRSTILKKSEQRLRVLADATYEGLVIHRDGTIIDTNERFREMIGGRDALGRPLASFLPAQVDAAGKVLCEDGEDGDETLLTPDGQRVPVETLCRELDEDRLVTAVRDLTQRYEARRRIRELAAHDGLTGLLNRRSFDDLIASRLDEAASDPDGPALALLMIDLDRFKPVNDTYGHAAGDALLRALAGRFTACVREGDAVARIGGDEFAVIARVAKAAEANGLAERLRTAAGEPFEIEGVRLEVGASIGIALGPRDARTDDELRQAADVALYEAKRRGRDKVTVFEPSMGVAVRARRDLEVDLRRALARNQMTLHYQVQHDLKAGRTIGYEALMRWKHPERGMIPPGDFIPLAEETGLIVPLGRWALERAAVDFARFDGTTRVSVNVSPVQFERGDVVADVHRALRLSGLAAERLEIEVTEQLLLSDTDGTLTTLDTLRDMGVSLSLDDFGSGYSSLAYLTRYPFSKIKIDRQFVDRMGSDERSHALVRSILALASSLGLRVTAEGVETHSQLATLATGRCDEAQGYLLGRPCPFDELEAGGEPRALMA